MVAEWNKESDDEAPLEMMLRRSVIPPTMGLGPRIVPAGFDASLKFLMGLTHP